MEGPNQRADLRTRSRSENALKWLLRIGGIIGCLAIVGVVIPHSWMIWCVLQIEPGSSNGILIPYFARSLSLYALLIGLLLLVFSTDVRHYRTPIKVTAISCILGDAAFCVYAYPYISYLLEYKLFLFILADATYALVVAIAVLVLQRIMEGETRASQNDEQRTPA